MLLLLFLSRRADPAPAPTLRQAQPCPVEATARKASPAQVSRGDDIVTQVCTHVTITVPGQKASPVQVSRGDCQCLDVVTQACVSMSLQPSLGRRHLLLKQVFWTAGTRIQMGDPSVSVSGLDTMTRACVCLFVSFYLCSLFSAAGGGSR